jgi:hypothetical protein
MPGILDLVLSWSNLVSNSEMFSAEVIESFLQVMKEKANTTLRTTRFLVRVGIMK